MRACACACTCTHTSSGEGLQWNHKISGSEPNVALKLPLHSALGVSLTTFILSGCFGFPLEKGASLLSLMQNSSQKEADLSQHE